MKKLIVFFAVIALLAIFLGASGNALKSITAVDSTGSDTEYVTDVSGTSKPNDETGTNDSSTDAVKYTYNIKIYKSGSSTQLGTLKFDSVSETVSVRISGNSLIFESDDKYQPVQFTEYKSIDTVSPSVITPGDTVVYITYTDETTNPTHTHSYTITKNATCTTSGTKTCSCGSTVTIAALGHTWDTGSASDCTGNQTCYDCDAIGPAGPHKDYNNDDKCDYCDIKIYS